MQNFETRVTTRVLGEEQGFLPLNVIDVIRDGFHGMATFWQPSLDELERLNAGEPVRLIIMGVSHPPVIVEVGRLKEDLQG